MVRYRWLVVWDNGDEMTGLYKTKLEAEMRGWAVAQLYGCDYRIYQLGKTIKYSVGK